MATLDTTPRTSLFSQASLKRSTSGTKNQNTPDRILAPKTPFSMATEVFLNSMAAGLKNTRNNRPT